MNELPNELWVVLLLLLTNSILAMAETAIVSVRVSRLKELAEEGNRRAAKVLPIAEDPMAFLAAARVGVLLVAIIAGWPRWLGWSPTLSRWRPS
jgi:putative hemolysin